MLKILVSIAMLLQLAACSHNRMIVRMSDGLLQQGSLAFDAESDLDLIEQALPSNIKLMEVLLRSDPENDILLENLAKAYYAYGFAVWEERFAVDKKDVSKAKAVKFYDRAQAYSLRHLTQVNVQWQNFLDLDEKKLASLLQGLSREDHVYLFWLALSLGQKIQILQSDMTWVAKLPKAVQMMDKVLAWDETYYFGSPHLFMAVYYSSRPEMLGGNLKKAAEHFEKASKISGGHSKLADLYYAQFYASAKLDRQAFDSALKKISIEDHKAPEGLALLNAVAEKKAKRLSAMAEELF